MPHSCLTQSLKQTEKHHSLLLQALPKPLNLHMSPRDSKRLKLPRLQYKNIKMQLYAILLASEFQTLRNAKLVLHKACVIQNAQFCTKTFAVDSLSHATYSSAQCIAQYCTTVHQPKVIGQFTSKNTNSSARRCRKSHLKLKVPVLTLHQALWKAVKHTSVVARVNPPYFRP